MEQTISRTEQRARVYKLLSDCFQSPDGEIPDRFRELIGLLDQLHSGHRLEAQDDDIDPDQLRLEHARLFIGPFSLLVPPYGSMYLEQEEHLMGKSTQDVHRWYLSESMETSLKEMPDHICIELEFLYLLVFRELIAMQKKPSADEHRARYRDKQRQFLEAHLGRWIPAFEKKVREYAELDFYRNLAAAARLFIEADMQELRPC